jgi:hypothetical protein
LPIGSGIDAIHSFGIGIEDGIELGQLKQVVNLLRQIQKFELGALVLGRGIGEFCAVRIGIVC